MDEQNFARLARSPQLAQADTSGGSHKGIVVDVRDPFQRGFARVWCYTVHGDLPGLDISAIPWAEFKQPLRGSFSPPELWDRVLIDFEGGNRDSPVITGYWYGIPTGRGNLPMTRTKGSEIRPENWNQHDLYPENLMLACSGEGNAIWFEDKLMGGNYVSSNIQIVDTGAKFFQIRSIHSDVSDFASDSGVPDQLYGANVPERKALRDGMTPIVDPVRGSIDFGHQNLSRSLITDENSFTIDQMTQLDDQGNVAIDSVAAGGFASRTRQGQGFIAQASNSIFLNSPVGVFAPNMLSLPRRWD
jgi:hypothetical protein